MREQQSKTTTHQDRRAEKLSFFCSLTRSARDSDIPYRIARGNYKHIVIVIFLIG